ncbi:MAG: hypothetical protein OXF89_01020 [Rhodospirillaceae bacterium]|nr:hypothetical protein [Rhodospirillaceae bacterium]MCY4067081.1 hypothetical protein [Rhodospirillaceae bacterium]
MGRRRAAARAARVLRLVQALEAAPVFLFLGLMRLVPPPAASAIGGFIGRTLGPLLPFSRRAKVNLKRIFPDMPAPRRRQVVRRMWDNLGRVAAESARIEALWDPALQEALSETGIERLMAAARAGETVTLRGGRIEIRGAENFVRLLTHRGPALIFVPHMGNWEFLAVGAANFGAFTSVVFRRPNNPYVAWLVDRNRAGLFELLPKGYQGGVSAGRVMAEGGRLALLVDQKNNRGVALDFLGRPAMTGVTLARLALRFDAPVFGACCRRLGGRRFAIEIDDPITVERSGDDRADEARFMQRVNDRIAEWVRETPDQWLWLHRRWNR